MQAKNSGFEIKTVCRPEAESFLWETSVFVLKALQLILQSPPALSRRPYLNSTDCGY